jgi:hypothetical protein
MPALTSLANLKPWIYPLPQAPATYPTNDEALLTSLINQISAGIINSLQRPPLVRTTFPEVRDGVGNRRLTLRNWPVVNVSSVTVNGCSIPANSTFGQSGYSLTTWDGTNAGNPQEIVLCGYEFHRGAGNVQIVYQSGYCVQNEAQTVAPSTYKVTPNTPYGSWAQDDGVAYANGTPLTPVASAPSVGQYVPPAPFQSSPVLFYQFSASDVSAGVLLNYSYIPADLEEACIEWVGERYRYKDRIGQTSMSQSGVETASFSLKMPDHIKQILQPYRKVIPL